jgi:hypothetical protein
MSLDFFNFIMLFGENSVFISFVICLRCKF